MTQTVAVIDYGMGNLHSVESALREAGASDVVVTADAEAILAADRIVFPGVGAIRDCLAEFRRLGCDTALRLVIDRGTPVLGICVGMQSLMARSEENGGVDCLGFFDGTVTRFPRNHSDADGTKLKVPHMGWNQLHDTGDSPYYLQGIDRPLVYFVHSYWLQTIDPSMGHTQTNYGQSFVSSIWTPTVFAAQFHPEKSGQVGVQLLRNVMRHFAHLK